MVDLAGIPGFQFPEIPEALNRTFVVVNCAASADGKLALPDGRQTRISSDDDIALVYRLRNWADAVVVGVRTVIRDDPRMTIKKKYVPDPEHPLRIVVDSRCRTPAGSLVLNDVAPTLIVTTERHGPCPEGAEVLECGSGERVDLPCLISHLWKRGIKKVMVEGGGTLIASFLKEGLVDVFMIFIGDMVIGGTGGPTPVMGEGAKDLEDIVMLERYAVIPMEKGVRIHYRVGKG